MANKGQGLYDGKHTHTHTDPPQDGWVKRTIRRLHSPLSTDQEVWCGWRQKSLFYPLRPRSLRSSITLKGQITGMLAATVARIAAPPEGLSEKSPQTPKDVGSLQNGSRSSRLGPASSGLEDTEDEDSNRLRRLSSQRARRTFIKTRLPCQYGT